MVFTNGNANYMTSVQYGWTIFRWKVCKVVIMYSEAQVIEVCSMCGVFFIIMRGTNIPTDNDE